MAGNLLEPLARRNQSQGPSEVTLLLLEETSSVEVMGLKRPNMKLTSGSNQLSKLVIQAMQRSGSTAMADDQFHLFALIFTCFNLLIYGQKKPLFFFPPILIFQSRLIEVNP